jgi:hypothetical protein
MKNKELVAVTIPIYKNEIDKYELMSITQCVKVLGKYTIIFFAPFSLDTSFYENFCEGKVKYKIERFEDSYFTGIPGYNKLMLSKHFYQRFIAFKYILIYQLDAFVFKDELEYWCKRNYTYIAAPSIEFVESKVLEDNGKSENGMKFLSRYRWVYYFLNKIGFKEIKFKHIENGGLSLRKVSDFILLLSILKKKSTQWNINEDTFFVYWLNVFFFYFRLPSEFEALHFSFEKNPSYSFRLLESRLPFGCHAFLKFEKAFWSNYIPFKLSEATNTLFK